MDFSNHGMDRCSPDWPLANAENIQIWSDNMCSRYNFKCIDIYYHCVQNRRIKMKIWKTNEFVFIIMKREYSRCRYFTIYCWLSETSRSQGHSWTDGRQNAVHKCRVVAYLWWIDGGWDQINVGTFASRSASFWTLLWFSIQSRYFTRYRIRPQWQRVSALGFTSLEHTAQQWHFRRPVSQNFVQKTDFWCPCKAALNVWV